MTVQEMLNQANGRRRTRLCSEYDVRQVIKEAIREEYGYTTGGHVANAYKYPSVTTVLLAWRYDNTIRIAAAVGNGHKNSSAVTPFGVTSARDKHIREWIADGNIHDAQVIMSMRDARRYVVSSATTIITESDRATMRRLPNIVVTLQDSLDSGNCLRESEKVAGWFKNRATVTARRLLAKVIKREPSLYRYALRAIITAVRKQEMSIDNCLPQS